MQTLTEFVILDHTALVLGMFLGTIIIGFIFRRLFSNTFSKIVYRFLPEKIINIQDCIDLLRKPFELLLFWVFLFLAAQSLHVPASWNFKPVGEFYF